MKIFDACCPSCAVGNTIAVASHSNLRGVTLVNTQKSALGALIDAGEAAAEAGTGASVGTDQAMGATIGHSVLVGVITGVTVYGVTKILDKIFGGKK